MPTVDAAESNGVLDRFPSRIVDVVDFHDCAQGLGLKIFGGRSCNGDDHGIYVKNLVPDGLAALSDRLKPGDQLLEVNGRSLYSMTNSRAVSMLRACAAQRILTLVISRDAEAYKGYQRLCSSVLSGSTKSLNVSDEIPTKSKLLDKWGDSRSAAGYRSSPVKSETEYSSTMRPDTDLRFSSANRNAAKNNVPRDQNNTFSPRSDANKFTSTPREITTDKSSTAPSRNERAGRAERGSAADDYSEGQISPISLYSTSTQEPKSVTVEYRTGLGMSICGGTNKSEGPGIHIDSVIKGGDVDRQAVLKAGDELISVNGNILQGLSHGRAMKVLTRLKLKQVKQVEIIYRSGDGISPRKPQSGQTSNSTPTNGTSKKSAAFSSSSRLSALKDHGASPSKTNNHNATPSKIISSRNSHSGSNKLGGTPATRSITDTATNVLNTQLDEGSSPLRAKSLAPSQQISMEKLVVALEYLGYNPSTSQLQTLKNKLNIDSNNKVRYSEFVEAAREVFAYKLKDKESKLMLKSTSMDDISRSRVELNKSLNTLNDYKTRGTLERSKISALSSSVPDLSNSVSSHKHSDELRSASSLANPASNLLDHVSSSRKSTLTVPGDILAASPVSNYSASGWSLPQYDKDYSSSDPADVIRECAILAAELRKAEKVILQYKVITEKLVNFASNVQTSFKAEVSRSRSLERGTALDRSRTRQSLATVIHGSNKTIADAQEMLHEEHLPPGWEEAFTEDGAKYYINHFSQSTSWDRPNG